MLFLGVSIGFALLRGVSANRTWRQCVLLIVNLTFLGSFARAPLSLLPFAGFVVLGFVLVRQMHRPVRAYAIAIAMVLLIFFWLKRYTFMPKALFLPYDYVQIGLSYVFFRVLHLVIDAKDDRIVRDISWMSYLNFTLNFTSLVSGPIQRYQDYRETAEVAPLPLDAPALGVAGERIVIGLFKLWVGAASMGALQKVLLQHSLADAAQITRSAYAAALCAAYPVYLYFNFSGYTDFVIGVARLFGIRLPENFNRPFTATSFIDYWSRWHMSLSNWLKYYVYNPLMLALMRRVRSPDVLPYVGSFALFVTFFLIGAWHGRTSQFLFFGFLNGLGVAANQAYRIAAARRLGRKPFARVGASPIYRFICRGMTFTWVAFTLLWFWSNWPMLSRIAGLLGTGGVAAALATMLIASSVVLGAAVALHDAVLRVRLRRVPVVTHRYARTALLTVMLVSITTVQSVMAAAAPDIVYKDF